MRHTTKGIIAMVAIVLATGGLATSAGAFAGPGGSTERATAGEPHAPLAVRTPTELGQRVAAYASPSAQSSGFDWGDAGIGAGLVLALGLGLGGLFLVSVRRNPTGGSDRPLASA